MRVLILGGTAEARALAAALVAAGHDVTSSLAGRVSRPRLPVGSVRIGGFNGAAGLADHLRRTGTQWLVDATHPFATTMTANAAAAAAETGIPAVRLARPGWARHPHARGWHWVDDYEAARTRAELLGERPFVTTGRQTLGAFRPWARRAVLVRVVEPLDAPAPTSWTVVQDRGPHEVAGERALMRAHGIQVLLTKDSGGSYTAAKLEAAHELGIAVVVVRRPAPPSGLEEVSDVAGVLARLGAR